MNYSTQLVYKNILGFIRDITGFIVSCNLTFIHLIDFIYCYHFKHIVNA